MDPISVKKGIIGILKSFFQQDSVFPYDEDLTKTRVIIADIYGVNRENVEQYPLIAVARGGMQFDRVGMGDRAYSIWAASRSPQPKDVFAGIVRGLIRCHCMSYSGIEAEQLAVKVANFIQMTQDEIATRLKIRMDPVAIDEESHLKDWPPGLVDVPVSFKYIYSAKWSVTDLDTRIRGAKLTM